MVISNLFVFDFTWKNSIFVCIVYFFRNIIGQLSMYLISSLTIKKDDRKELSTNSICSIILSTIQVSRRKKRTRNTAIPRRISNNQLRIRLRVPSRSHGNPNDAPGVQVAETRLGTRFRSLASQVQARVKFERGWRTSDRRLSDVGETPRKLGRRSRKIRKRSTRTWST